MVLGGLTDYSQVDILELWYKFVHFGVEKSPGGWYVSGRGADAHRGVAHLRDAEHGTYTTVKARFRPWLSGESPQNLMSCSLFARKRYVSGRSADAHRRVALRAGPTCASVGLTDNSQVDILELWYKFVHFGGGAIRDAAPSARCPCAS